MTNLLVLLDERASESASAGSEVEHAELGAGLHCGLREHGAENALDGLGSVAGTVCVVAIGSILGAKAFLGDVVDGRKSVG